MNTLPTEIIQLILYNILDVKDYKRSCLVCKKWWKLLKNNVMNVADANVYQKIKYLSYNYKLFPSWTGKEILCTTGYLTNRILHGKQIVNISRYKSACLLEANWMFGKLHGPYTCWRIIIGSYTLYIKHGEIKIIDRRTVDTPNISTNIYQICNYEYGEKHGTEIRFNIFGDMKYSCQWHRGKKHGEEIFLSEPLTVYRYCEDIRVENT